jgi:UDP-glucose 4-epimerase
MKFLSLKGVRAIGHHSLDSIEYWMQRATMEETSNAEVVWSVGKVSPFLAEHYPELVKEELSTFQKYLSLEGSKRVPLVLLSSGGCTYSSISNLGATEETLAAGVNEYGRTKLLLEHLLLESGIPGTILRLGNVYGKSALPKKGQGVITHWLANLQNGEPITIYGSGDLHRDYIYIEDVCEAIYKCQEIASDGEVFNVGTGIGTTLKQLLNLVEVEMQIEATIVFAPERPEDNFSYSLDCRKFESVRTTGRHEQIPNWYQSVLLQAPIETRSGQ